MIYIPSLLQKIAKFATSAVSSYNLLARAQNLQGYTMPDEDDEKPVNSKQNTALYNQIMRLAEQLPPPNEDTEEYDFKLGCYTVAELYRKALEINGGYNYLRDEVLRVQSVANEDDPQEEELVSLMDQIFIETKPFLQKNKNDLAKQDNPKDVAILKEIKQRYSTLDLAEQFGQAEFDKSGLGVNTDTGGGGGYQITGPGPLKNWADAYAGELSRLDEKLKDIENLKISNHGFVTKYEKQAENEILELKDIFTQLVEWSNQLAKIQSGPNSDSEDAQEGIKNTKKIIEELRKKALKKKSNLKISNAYINKEKIKKEIHNASSEGTKFILKQELELQDLLMRSDIRSSKEKVKEKRLRKEFINALKNKGKINDPEYIATKLKEIEDAKTDYETTKKEKSKEFTIENRNRKNQEGLLGRVKTFEVAMNTVKGDIIKQLRAKLLKDPFDLQQFDPFIKTLEEVYDNPELLQEVENKLELAQTEYIKNKPQFKEYEAKQKEMKAFATKIRNIIKNKMTGKLPQGSEIQGLINDAEGFDEWVSGKGPPYTQIRTGTSHKPLPELIEQLKMEPTK